MRLRYAWAQSASELQTQQESRLGLRLLTIQKAQTVPVPNIVSSSLPLLHF